MPRLTPELSAYVRPRWMTFLAEQVLKRTPRLSDLVSRDAEEQDPLDYRGILNVSGLAEQIANGDPEGDKAAIWTRKVRRWVSEDTAPEPGTIRRTLYALGFDWVIGLGRSGYKQHAIAMLHTLWALGSRRRVAAQAKAIFSGTDYARGVIAQRATRIFRVTSVSHFERLDRAAKTCWPKVIETVPTRCIPPRDFPASQNLYAAWMLLDAAIRGRHGSLEQRLRGINESVAREIDAWVKEIMYLQPRKSKKGNS